MPRQKRLKTSGMPCVDSPQQGDKIVFRSRSTVKIYYITFVLYISSILRRIHKSTYYNIYKHILYTESCGDFAFVCDSFSPTEMTFTSKPHCFTVRPLRWNGEIDGCVGSPVETVAGHQGRERRRSSVKLRGSLRPRGIEQPQASLVASILVAWCRSIWDESRC